MQSACSQLCANKWDGERKINSSALKHAPDVLLQHLACFYNTVGLTGYVQQDLTVNTIFPLFKQAKHDPSLKSKNWAIVLLNQFSKLLHYLILAFTIERPETSDMQFAFKLGSSCNQCTYIVKEVMRYFVANGSEHFTCLLDLSKAFDRVNFSTLVNKLTVIEMPAHYIRLITVLYSGKQFWVSWNGALSDSFEAVNGSKQSGVLSPVLSVFGRFVYHADWVDTDVSLAPSSTMCWPSQMI